MDNEDISRMLDFIEEKEREGLNKWECDFIDSILESIGSEIPLSNKQKEKIKQIWERIGGLENEMGHL